jgi:UDP-N-acetyl-2-amino-2-deoxyglucuronate dehydrogenase
MMSNPEPVDLAPIQERTWTVYRQDGNGNRFVVSTRLSREEAERLVTEFEARGHKQVYWTALEST